MQMSVFLHLNILPSNKCINVYLLILEGSLPVLLPSAKTSGPKLLPKYFMRHKYKLMRLI